MRLPIHELAELLNRPHNNIDKIISDDKKWMISYRPNFIVVIKHLIGDKYENVGFYDSMNKTIGSFPDFMNYQEKIACAIWLATGEILLDNEQYVQGYSSILPTIIKVTPEITVDFLTSSITATKKIQENDYIVHEFILRKGDEYERNGIKSEFHYRVRFLFVTYENFNKNLTHYNKEIVSPLDLPEVLKQLDYDTLIINHPDKKEDITKCINHKENTIKYSNHLLR